MANTILFITKTYSCSLFKVGIYCKQITENSIQHRFYNTIILCLHLRPIIDQTGTIYIASKVVAKYLSPLSKNEFSITDTLSIHNSSNDESYEDVPYDVESLFRSIPVQETIDHFIQRMYVRKEIKRFCKKSIFKKLLLRLTIECVFSSICFIGS